MRSSVLSFLENIKTMYGFDSPVPYKSLIELASGYFWNSYSVIQDLRDVGVLTYIEGEGFRIKSDVFNALRERDFRYILTDEESLVYNFVNEDGATADQLEINLKKYLSSSHTIQIKIDKQTVKSALDRLVIYGCILKLGELYFPNVSD